MHKRREDYRFVAADWAELQAVWSELSLSPSRFRGAELGAQEAGWVFEWWVYEAFRLSGADGQPPFVVRLGPSLVEEIDGAVFVPFGTFLVECKFQDAKVTIEPIVKLRSQLERRTPNTMGAIFSKSGFTHEAVTLLSHLSPCNVLLFTGDDIELMQHRPASMVEALRVKYRVAVMEGKPDAELFDTEEFGGESV
ncbi:restriction endonuclease [Candidatus Poribacteria bacterium]|nr:restriction endonuclease [Candidatus Poribacteria bacterium]